MKSEFTYQAESIVSPLETYEWDNTWLERITEKSKKRVLYIGDSISCGIRRFATDAARGEILFDGFGTSKAIDNPFYFDSIRLFAAQEGERSAVLFNNGLHGWHLSAKEYAQHYEKMILFLKSEFKDTPLYLLLSTPVRNNPERKEEIIKRNKEVIRLSKKYGIKTVDVFSFAEEIKELGKDDGVHFTDEGYEALAKSLLSEIKVN